MIAILIELPNRVEQRTEWLQVNVPTEIGAIKHSASAAPERRDEWTEVKYARLQSWQHLSLSFFHGCHLLLTPFSTHILQTLYAH